MLRSSPSIAPTTTDERGLGRLFHPRTVAVVGASSSSEKAGGAMLDALSRFDGQVYPVNSRADHIGARECYPTVSAIPDQVDLAVLTVPAAAVPEVVADCGRAGVGAAIVCAGGFSESGAAGEELQRQTVEIAQAAGVRLLGPNTSGFVAPRNGLAATFMPSARNLPAGSLAVVAQSGGVNLASAFMATQLGVGLSLAVGLGNAVDVDFVDVLDYLASDVGTTAIALHLEGVDDGRALMAAVRRVTATKPVVVFKVGRSDVGEFAQSHTGALAGDWAVARAALESSGAVVVDSLTDLVEAAAALSTTRLQPHPNPGVGVITGQAGPGLIIADGLAAAGVRVPPLAPETRTRLSSLLPPLTYQANPVDTGRPESTFTDVIRTVGADPQIDALLVYALHELQAEEALAELGGDHRGDGPVPIVAVTGGPADVVETQREELGARGIPIAVAPDRGAFVMAALVADAKLRHLAGSQDATPAPGPVIEIAAGSGPLDENEGKRILAELGIAVPARRICIDRDSAHRALSELHVPVVVKILDADVTHKAAAGGVQLGVRTPQALDEALTRTAAAATQPGRAQWLLEEQIEDGPELIVGGVRDPAFGAVVAVGAGGGNVDLMPAPVLRPAPLGPADAAATVASLPPAVQKALGAARLEELAEIVRVVGDILVDHPEVSELDINPLRATSTGLIALDAVVILDTAQKPTQSQHLSKGGSR